ncbi:hypothetical protein PTTG_28163 [Puccinia triticina 1-1 BBBD Race 1]|uniref:Uncharacterized protein n=1 Tax=Puccinia triticina (isolate 1-1 / race 1 (BBBD)) TaxID=630390 RepID=A0A180GFY5_PUCT1|nr:hypothetical protein PTTG_28163 [Puccinia triticina 1-1 BBBD Race 1]
MSITPSSHSLALSDGLQGKNVGSEGGMAEAASNDGQEGLSKPEIMEIDEAGGSGSALMMTVEDRRRSFFVPQFEADEEVDDDISSRSSGSSTPLAELSPRRGKRLRWKTKLMGQIEKFPTRIISPRIQGFLASFTSFSHDGAFFDCPLKRLPSFSRLGKMSKEQVDQEIDMILDRVFASKRRVRKYSQVIEDYDQASIKQRFKETLDQLRLFTEQAAAIEDRVRTRSQQILSNLRAILVIDPASSKTGTDPLVRLFKQLSKYQYEKLLVDRGVIQTYLAEESPYLVDLFGFFGPRDVILPMIKAEVEQQVRSGRKLEVLQRKLAELVAFDHQVNLAMVDTFRACPGYPKWLVNKIQVLGRDLVTSFSSLEELDSILIAIENMDVYQGFMNELRGGHIFNPAKQMVLP